MKASGFAVAVGLLATLALPSFAGFSITYSDRGGDPHFSGSYYYGPPVRHHHYYYRHPWWPRYRPIVVPAPVVMPAPVYYAPAPYVEPAPVVTAPPAPLSGNYGQDLAGLNEKLSRLRAVVQKQRERDGITREQYGRFMNVLDGIEHDEHARSYDHGGYLSGDDFADLFRRLDQAGEDIEIALGQ